MPVTRDLESRWNTPSAPAGPGRVTLLPGTTSIPDAAVVGDERQREHVDPRRTGAP
jgi:hypothetical protein